ncbi:MAG TPA: hypothetical protein VGB62_09370 [Allosphingosinicella sp.]|jgi:hypothetical protein
MALQAKADAQLKFKQIDLQKGLLDLFVDVPVALAPVVEFDYRRWEPAFSDSEVSARFSEAAGNMRVELKVAATEEPAGTLRTINLLSASGLHPRILLEGAPGQGKSTISQFLCQTHRIRFLDRSSELKSLDSTYLPREARLPFKVDLRDYATWLNGRDPFSENGSAALPQEARPVLESFLAHQVSRLTGLSFTADDLADVASSSQFLVVLDGFDEVADIGIRSRIIREVGDASTRMAEITLSTQFVVTSRPSAFANSPGFPREEWQYLQMQPLTRNVIDIYSKKWLDARGAEARERTTILGVLTKKLEQAHVRDLSRNPMQLAILIALISVQGASLPDKRTTLYDRYIDIFLNRESEKSDVVRDHRETLVQVHRFLAWRLQVESEENGSAGSITEDRLKLVVRDFLRKSGHEENLVDVLFSGVVERVVALVQRVQGNYEFEVQPLREYFAARYLYDTAPYCPAGERIPGTLPERFDALLRNFYWLNVARFYAGCYNTGELSSLIDNLDELSSSPHFQFIAHSASLRLVLLSDYVFSQYPALSSKLLRPILNPDAIRLFLANKSSLSSSEEAFSVPAGAGRKELVRFCVDQIVLAAQWEDAYWFSRVVALNTDSSEAEAIWFSLRDRGVAQKRLAGVGSYLGVFNSGNFAFFESAQDYIGRAEAILEFFDADRFDVLDADIGSYEVVMHSLLDRVRSFYPMTRGKVGVGPDTYWITIINSLLTRPLKGIQGDPGAMLMEAFLERSGTIRRSVERDAGVVPQGAVIGEQLYDALKALTGIKMGDLKSRISLLDDVFEQMSLDWGSRLGPRLASIGFVDALRLSESEAIGLSEASALSKALLVYRSRKRATFWEKLLTDPVEDSDEDRVFALLAFTLWAPAKVFIRLASLADKVSSSLSSSSWGILKSDISSRLQIGNASVQVSLTHDLFRLGERGLYLLLQRASNAEPVALYMFEERPEECSTEVLRILAQLRTGSKLESESDWLPYLDLVRLAHLNGAVVDVRFDRYARSSISMPASIAEAVCASPSRYPLAVIGIAESVLAERIGANAVPVGKVAVNAGWFSSSAEPAMPTLI